MHTIQNPSKSTLPRAPYALEAGHPIARQVIRSKIPENLKRPRTIGPRVAAAEQLALSLTVVPYVVPNRCAREGRPKQREA